MDSNNGYGIEYYFICVLPINLNHYEKQSYYHNNTVFRMVTAV